MDLMDVRREMMGVIARMAGSQIITATLLSTYTVQQSWENDTLGNPITIYTALGLSVNDLNDYSETFLCVFENNNASNTTYKVDFIQYGKDKDSGPGSVTSYSVRNDKNGVKPCSKNASTWASVGTVIKIYKVKINI